MVELHYSILVIGWYFSVKNEWIPRVDVYYAPRTRVAVCFDGGSCVPIYKEVVYKVIRPGRMFCGNTTMSSLERVVFQLKMWW